MNSELERAAFAAGMMKAAEIVKNSSNCETDHYSGFQNYDHIADAILSAIHADTRAALSTEAQPEVTGAVAEVANDERTNYAYGIVWIKRDVAINTKLYPPSAIEAAVREKLEEAAQIVIASRWLTVEQALEIAEPIRALMESPQTSVEEPAN